MLEEIRNHVRAGRSFAFETTLSGKLYARWVPGWRDQGYRVNLIYLKLASVELARSRVGARILQGGHGVPGDVLVRRFVRSAAEPNTARLACRQRESRVALARLEDLTRQAQIKGVRTDGPVNLRRALIESVPLLAFGDGAGYHSLICSPLDTPQGLGRGYFVSGGLDAH